MNEKSKRPKFTGPQSERFQSAPKNQIGPGDYKTQVIKINPEQLYPRNKPKTTF